jgi:hypothetical protein
MGFREIIDRWRAGSRPDDADHAETALHAFVDLADADRKAKNEQVLENLGLDRKISQAKREELLKQLLTVDPRDSESVIEKVVTFCRAHQCSGPGQPTAQRSSLGHVETREKLKATLASSRGASATSFATRRRRGAGPTVAAILRLDLARQTDRLRGICLSKRVMWSFYQPRSPDEPFRGVSKEASELVRRLGLGLTDLSKDELILWGHRLESHQTAHIPTAFDAADYEFFRPGGTTEPLSGDDGLREVVHRPITGDQLSHPIESAV